MNRLLPAALAALLLPFVALADEDNVQLANATGYGTTVEEAKKAAVRSAVEAVVGSMVDSETLVENDELVQDVIDTYSNGTATDVKIVGEPAKTDTGLWKVRVQAKVKKAALVEKLKTATKTEAGVEGESLYQRMVSARQNLAEAGTVMKKLFDPERVQFVLKAEPDPGDTGSAIVLDDATGEVAVRIKAWVDMVAYKQWIDEILEKLGPMAVKKQDGVLSNYSQEQYKTEKKLDFGVNIDGLQEANSRHVLDILCNLRAMKCVRLTFDKDKGALMDKALPGYRPVLRVSLVDKTGEEIKIVDWPDARGSSALAVNHGMANRSRDIVPGWSGSQYSAWNVFWVKVPFGKLSEQDVKDIDKITVEVKMNADYR